MEIKELMQLCVQYGASDLHLMVGTYPMLRVNGELWPVPKTEILIPSVVMGFVQPLMTPEQARLLETNRELDFSYAIPSGERFRVNTYYEKGNVAVAMRMIPQRIRTLGELMLPEVIESLTKLKQGLVLVTGPTGHGKSTTLAAMVSLINQTRKTHIVTIEDPIEFVYPPDKSIISQREMHADTLSWAVALRSVLREDPDVVLIGEMRDYETIEAALTIAETGHLVLATLHTNSAASTIDRIIDVFPEMQQRQVRMQLSNSLEAVLSQRLVPSIDRQRVAVVEVMLATPAVRSLIRDGKSHMLANAIQTSGDMGMATLDMALSKSYLKKQIELGVAREYATNVEDFNRLINRES